MPTIDDTMRALPARFRPKMAGNMQATIQFHFTGPDGGEWVLIIEGGKCTTRPGNAENPDATVTMDAKDFVGINIGAPSREYGNMLAYFRAFLCVEKKLRPDSPSRWL